MDIGIISKMSIVPESSCKSLETKDSECKSKKSPEKETIVRHSVPENTNKQDSHDYLKIPCGGYKLGGKVRKSHNTYYKKR